MLQPVTAARKLTIDDLFATGDDRSELVHGEIVQKAAGNAPHGLAEDGVLAWARRRYARRPGGRWPGGWWIISEIYVAYGTHEVFGHDVAGWRRDRLPALPAETIAVRPDWVCEVLSPGHEKRDLVDKLGVMHAAGVPDYWVVDHEKKLLFLYRHSPTGYVMRAVGADAVIDAPPFGATELRVACILGDEDDEE